MTEWLLVKNWEKFQHYKKQNPPWIRFHKSTLVDHELAALTIPSRLLMSLIWLIASEKKGHIKNDPSMISFRVHMPQDVVSSSLKELISKGFLLATNQSQSVATQPKLSHSELSVSELSDSASGVGGLGEGNEPSPVLKFEEQAIQGLPKELDSPNFRAAWIKWEHYYHRLRGVMQPQTRINVWSELIRLGVPESIKRINDSISKGWKSIVTDPDYRSGFKNKEPPAQTRRLENLTEKRFKAERRAKEMRMSGKSEDEVFSEIETGFGRDLAEVVKKSKESA